MPEFTGERIIPGQVEADLWNEHVSRYWLACRYAPGARVLDAGCGTGYGAQLLAASARSVTAVDIAEEAVASVPRSAALRVARASCSQLPFRSASFDLVVSFEVIEHIDDWQACLSEFRRVLAPSGVLIISTPNRTYYAESRSESGPNPFHLHEFDYNEFASALAAHFPQVDILTQNHADGVVFQTAAPASRAGIAVESAHADPETSNFFVAVCRTGPGPAPEPFVYLPSAANVLRERERHIALLEADVERLRAEKQNMVEMFRAQETELRRSNEWAGALDARLQAASARIVALQDELAAAQKQAVEQLEAERKAAGEELARCIALLDRAEATVVERSEWAKKLDAENLRLRDENLHLQDQNAKLNSTLEMIKDSRWVRLGDKFGVGPLRDEN